MRGKERGGGVGDGGTRGEWRERGGDTRRELIGQSPSFLGFSLHQWRVTTLIRVPTGSSRASHEND